MFSALNVFAVKKSRPRTKEALLGGPRKRRLVLEQLEVRHLLSVSITDLDFAAIRAAYPDLDLSDDMAEYNIIEVTGTTSNDDDLFAFSEAGLRAAIAKAGTTTANDLIVVRTTETQDTITLDGSELGINIDAKEFEGVTLVSFGTSNLMIDAAEGSRVFNISSGSTVALAGLMITNGKVAGDGGGIYNAGELTITNCTISGNSATYPGNSSSYRGGGIYNVGDLIVTGSTFSGNSAPMGGGIYNIGELIITDSMISENSAESGGGICNYYDMRVSDGVISYYNGILTMANCTVTENSATYGGGIYSYYGVLTVTESTVSGNTASSNGGGISCGGTLIVTNSTISDNSGGGISYSSINDGTFTMTGSTVSGNSGSEFGGIYAISGKQAVTITDCTISGNSAVSEGGGIRISGQLTIANSRITENSVSSGNGGGIYSAYSFSTYCRLVVTDCIISENSANNGGGISSSSDTLTVTNSTISNNSASWRGGGISGSGTITITNSMIIENSASSYSTSGGGIYCGGTLSIINSTISGNSASSGGGIYGGVLTVTNCTITGNSAYSGGGIYSEGNLTLYNTIIAKNSSDIRHYSGTLQGYNNLIGDGTGQTPLFNGVNGNLVGTAANPIDPGIAELTQQADGSWICGALLPESPAINTGSNEYAQGDTDIFGAPRIQGGAVNIGAAEGVWEPRQGVTYYVTSLEDAVGVDGVLTFREAFEAANRNIAVGNAPAGSYSEKDTIGHL